MVYILTGLFIILFYFFTNYKLKKISNENDIQFVNSFFKTYGRGQYTFEEVVKTRKLIATEYFSSTPVSYSKLGFSTSLNKLAVTCSSVRVALGDLENDLYSLLQEEECKFPETVGELAFLLLSNRNKFNL